MAVVGYAKCPHMTSSFQVTCMCLSTVHRQQWPIGKRLRCVFGGVTCHWYLTSSSNICSRLKTVIFEMLAARTEFSVGFHCARLRCTCFTHFSLKQGFVGNLKRLTLLWCVFEHTAATQQVGMVLELAFSQWRMRNHTHNRFWIWSQTGRKR